MFEHFSEADWQKRMNRAIPHSGFTLKKHLRCLFTLIYNDFRHGLNKLFRKNRYQWDWWNQLHHHNEQCSIILGAFPIAKKFGFFQWRNDCQYLTSELNVQAVLSMVEPYELNAGAPFLAPIKPSDWREKGVSCLQLPTPDFSDLHNDTIEEAIAFIDWNVKRKRNIYIHCKAGRGRSAVVLAGYLMRCQGMSVEQAISLIKQCRPQINQDFIRQVYAKECH